MFADLCSLISSFQLHPVCKHLNWALEPLKGSLCGWLTRVNCGETLALDWGAGGGVVRFEGTYMHVASCAINLMFKVGWQWHKSGLRQRDLFRRIFWLEFVKWSHHRVNSFRSSKSKLKLAVYESISCFTYFRTPDEQLSMFRCLDEVDDLRAHTM